MNNTPPMSMNVAQTVDYLVEALGGKAANWATWLSNDRKTGRKQRLLTEHGPGRPRYDRALVDTFIYEQRAKLQQHNDVPSDEGSAQAKQLERTDRELARGRRFNPHITAMTQEEEGFDEPEPYVMLVLASPLALFQLSSGEARRIATRLLTAADRVDESARKAP